MRFLTVKEYDFTCLKYLRLFPGCQASGFQSPVWLNNFYRHTSLIPGIENIVVIGCDSGTDELVMVLPLRLSRKESDTLWLEFASLGIVDYAFPVIKNSLISNQKVLCDIADYLRVLLIPYSSLCIAPIRLFIVSGSPGPSGSPVSKESLYGGNQ